MIPGPFVYHRPSSVDEAIKILSDIGDDARPLAGGHSLIPMMKLRMATPEHLVDLGGLTVLKDIKEDRNSIVIGAMVTQAELQFSDLLSSKLPILKETSHMIADPQIRYMGTIGGNVANGDPGNDMPAVMKCLDATYVLKGKAGERQVKAREFYNGAYDTALQTGEILTAVRIPTPPAGHGYAYEKLKRKIGDYATAAAAVMLTMTGGKVASCAITLTNVADTALFAKDASALVVGTACDDATIKKAAAAAKAITEPAGDGRGPPEYRAEMAAIMVVRALVSARSRAKGA
ncbi:MAG: xanthine dehydrogenase family protein subunit M [Bradyrhizobiaceae bacterium]|nr:MAG: xanthine dehydrogenase family protein subunit M [Bradyrhizobiaceae bacterium]